MHHSLITTSIAILGLGLVACGDDDGGTNQNNDTVIVCGDGVVEGGEQCDDGPDNSDNAPDACRSDCRLPWCGDDVVDSDEECDDGAANSDQVGNACRKDCTLPTCGDGALDPGEECDDGNRDPGDGCDAQCDEEPFWQCAGAPSVCVCRDYHRGSDCATCVVHVHGDPAIATRDGLSWTTAYASIQEGIYTALEARAGCEVWVAAGTYYQYVDTPGNSLHLATGVGVYGGFDGTETARDQRDPGALETVISGARDDAADTPHVFHVVQAIDTSDATLDGFTVRGGRALGLELYGDDRGGGLLADSSAIVLRQVRLTDNEAQYGGGAYFYASPSRLERCMVDDNQAPEGGAGILAEQSDLHLQDTELVGNHSFRLGAGMLSLDSLPLIERSAFVANIVVSFDPGTGGALAFDGNNQPLVLDTVFVGNSAGGQGAAVLNKNAASPELDGCVFLGNGTGVGGGGPVMYSMRLTGTMAMVPAAPVIRNSLVVGNVGLWAGAFTLREDTNLTLVNSVFVGNEAEYAGVAWEDDTGPGASHHVQITNCTLWGNSSASGLGTLNGIAWTLDIDNSIVWTGLSMVQDPIAGSATLVSTTVENSVVQYMNWPGGNNAISNPQLAVDPWTTTPTGTWTAASFDELTHRAMLEDSTAAWSPGALAGRFLRSNTRWLYVVDNGATWMEVYGASATVPASGDTYILYDLRPTAGSSCEDRGSDQAPNWENTDITGTPWADDGGGGSGTDCGAYEGG